jgi:predicted nucleic acid-binding protein
VNVLIDTNILTGYALPSHPAHSTVISATRSLHSTGGRLHVLAQNLVEFYSVATRPVDRNGLDMPPERALLHVAEFERVFALCPETKPTFPLWKQLVLDRQCRGKVVHDVRLVAGMMANGLTHILTFNSADFSRFPEITVIDPASVPAPKT